MAVSTITSPTFAEMSRAVNVGWTQIQPLIELLSIRHGLHGNVGFQQANGAVSHRTQVRTGLSTPVWKMFNRGTPASTDTVANVTFNVAKLKSLLEIDQDLVDISPNPAMYVLQRAAAHLEAMMQEWSSTAIYGTAAAPEEFVGISSMYSDTSASNGKNILKAGGIDASDNLSIWLVNAGPTVFGTYPLGSMAGLSRTGGATVWTENMGGTGNRGQVFREEFAMGGGFVVEDWRDMVRIANVDVSALVAQSADADLLFWTRKAKGRMSTRPIYRRFWLMNGTASEYLDHQRAERQVAGGGVTTQTIDGIETMMLHGIPIVIDDNLLNTEAAI